jgi:elongation factor P
MKGLGAPNDAHKFDPSTRRQQVASMPSYTTSDFRKGLKVQLDGEPYLMIEMEFMKPGKGQAVYRAKLRGLISGRILDRSYRSGESLEAADIDEGTGQYLYQDGTHFHFMDPESFEQYELTREQVGDVAQWLVEEMVVDVVFWNGNPITIAPPAHVEMKVTYTEPGAKGNSTGNVQKPATLHTGAEISVPIFINVDDVVRIDTRTGEYIERVSKS